MYVREAAAIVGVSPAVVRSWELHGLIEPRRSEAGYRVYAPTDVDRLRRIRDLVLGEGLNVAGVRRVLSERPARASDPAERRRAAAPVGRKLRALRRERQLSLRQLGAATGLSASHISALERSLTRPTLSALQKLSVSLGADVLELIGEQTAPQERATVVRRDAGRRLPSKRTGVQIEQLAPGATPLEPLRVRIAPGSGSGGSDQREGEAFVHVLAGCFELVLDQTETHVLERGDSIAFAGHRPHRWCNPGEDECVALWISSPPARLSG